LDFGCHRQVFLGTGSSGGHDAVDAVGYLIEGTLIDLFEGLLQSLAYRLAAGRPGSSYSGQLRPDPVSDLCVLGVGLAIVRRYPALIAAIQIAEGSP